MKKIIEEVKSLYFSIQNNKPLVHCICNAVTVNDCANVLLAIGARPTMASHIQEVAEITEGCKSLTCNLGATKDFAAISEAIKAANKVGHPVVIDPVGVSGSSFRREYLQKLLKSTQIACIRGNASEIDAIYKKRKTATGVDAILDKSLNEQEALQYNITIATKVSQEYHTIVCLSGVVDIITDGKHVYQIENGHPLMARITGSGCMSTVLTGAFISQTDNYLLATAASTVIMGICGELAADRCIRRGGGTMTFRQYLIDEISLFDVEVLEEYIKIKQ